MQAQPALSKSEGVRPEDHLAERDRLHGIIGRSPAMQRVFRIIEKVATRNTTVLISGRTGTGKELVARAIHAQSHRASRPFVDVNCGALPSELIESELFGCEKGAFTGATQTRKGLFEAANGSTIFLDEVQALKCDLQAKLLRVLQERVVRRLGGRENIPVDVRVIAATNQDICEAVRTGEFREDLYYRLNVVDIHLPDLKDHREDIPLLIDHFLRRDADPNTQPATQFSQEAMKLMLGAAWSGNVRELQNAVEHALAMASGPVLRISDLPTHLTGVPDDAGQTEAFEDAQSLKEMQRRYILRILEASGGNHSRAAEVLGIDRRTLYRQLDRYGSPGANSGRPDGAVLFFPERHL